MPAPSDVCLKRPPRSICSPGELALSEEVGEVSSDGRFGGAGVEEGSFVDASVGWEADSEEVAVGVGDDLDIDDGASVGIGAVWSLEGVHQYWSFANEVACETEVGQLAGG